MLLSDSRVFDRIGNLDDVLNLQLLNIKVIAPKKATGIILYSHRRLVFALCSPFQYGAGIILLYDYSAVASLKLLKVLSVVVKLALVLCT